MHRYSSCVALVGCCISTYIFGVHVPCLIISLKWESHASSRRTARATPSISGFVFFRLRLLLLFLLSTFSEPQTLYKFNTFVHLIYQRACDLWHENETAKRVSAAPGYTIHTISKSAWLQHDYEIDIHFSNIFLERRVEEEAIFLFKWKLMGY